MSQSIHSVAQESSSAELTQLQSALRYLVFDAHILRLSIEIFLCFWLYVAFHSLIPWEAFNIPLEWSALLCWTACVSITVVFDQCILCNTSRLLRKSYITSLNGGHSEALSLLESIGPLSTRFIPLPPSKYHLQRAELLLHQRDYSAALAELDRALDYGASSEEVCILRSRILRQQGNTDESIVQLDIAREEFGATPRLQLEEALIAFEEERDYRKAKRIFQEVVETAYDGSSTSEHSRQIAYGYWNACKLWTGHAEEGIEGLTDAIEQLRTTALFVETLRPVLAQLFVERGYYYATHREPEAAHIDISLAETICSHGKVQERSEEVKEELRWRYDG